MRDKRFRLNEALRGMGPGSRLRQGFAGARKAGTTADAGMRRVPYASPSVSNIAALIAS
jgi:hypothetical protein